MTDSKKSIYKPKAISGFPEWLPEERLIEQRWMDHIRRVFESYGFCSIETPAVEELDVLTAKGEVDKEIYIIDRLHKEDGSKSEARLALHFDQTVPLARYVALHFNDLVFPFKRYQMQKVWRGERPQVGRMREFYQCDIDIINVDNLPLSFDAEIPAVIYEVLAGLDIGRIQLRINNRKILYGFLEAIDFSQYQLAILRGLDKIEKMSIEEVLKYIKEEVTKEFIGMILKPNPRHDESLPPRYDSLEEKIRKFIILAKTKFTNAEHLEDVLIRSELEYASNPTFMEGIKELSFVLRSLEHLPEHAVCADLSIVRGLDYYTGTVYETKLLDVPEFIGSVCSGGRYDDLAGSYINKHLPGVGISIGFSRLFDVLRQKGRIQTGAKCPTDVLVILPSEEKRSAAHEAARQLRANGNNVEVYHAPKKIPDQMKYANKKLIPFVWFPPFEDGGAHEVKNMQSGEQQKAEATTWRAK